VIEADFARLDRILARLEPEDGAWLRDQLEPPWRRRRRRRAAGDAAVRDARVVFSNPHTTCAARSLSTALAAYLASNYRFEKDYAVLPEASVRHAMLHAIARANDGRPLGWRRIVDIWRLQIATVPR
jgi:hypothetical protein